jgi:hypothetical protein
MAAGCESVLRGRQQPLDSRQVVHSEVARSKVRFIGPEPIDKPHFEARNWRGAVGVARPSSEAQGSEAGAIPPAIGGAAMVRYPPTASQARVSLVGNGQFTTRFG